MKYIELHLYVQPQSQRLCKEQNYINIPATICRTTWYVYCYAITHVTHNRYRHKKPNINMPQSNPKQVDAWSINRASIFSRILTVESLNIKLLFNPSCFLASFFTNIYEVGVPVGVLRKVNKSITSDSLFIGTAPQVIYVISKLYRSAYSYICNCFWCCASLFCCNGI